MKTNSSYFLQSFLILVLATVFFLGLKQFLPKKIFSEKAGSTKNVLIDSMLLDAFDAEPDLVEKIMTKDDSLAKQPIVFEENDGIKFPEEKFENYKGNQYLIPFFEQLYQLETNKKGKVRIAYFGDSMTDGDMIVQDFRTYFQEKFGGQGVGFVAITSESAASRSSVQHEFSGNWKTQSYLNVKYPQRSFGVNGHVFFANDTAHSAWVKYKAGRSRYNTQLDNPTLFYGSGKNKTGRISYVLGKDTIRKTLMPNKILNTLSLSNAPIKQFKANFSKADSIPIYGFNFDDGVGVHVDNFSQRGNSGIPISKFDVATMKAFQNELQYNLIILHYGTNVLNYGTKDYTWYDRSMTKTINRLKECFPGVSILVVSTADKSSKYDLEMKTDSAVVPLTLSQKRYALKTQSSYINLYTLMGGDGSMVKWTEEEPALANKDYTHFNFRGAKKIAKIIYDQLDEGYQQYKVLRKNKKVIPPKKKSLIDTIFSKTETPEPHE
ncbi:membrane protein [Flavobacterium antarcticum]|uniref:membrane protein n=1 Tax=Flavobacterium antarcticum TaxID=271155 RepID=UPI0003B4FCBE|nr:membrane protein [Flavobacterium antarcticum]